MFSRSDESLYLRWVDGDLAAFDALYARYEGPLFGFLTRQLGSAADAEDALHETFLALLKERDRGRHATSFKAWIFEVARHLVLNRVRSSSRAEKAHVGIAHLEPVQRAALRPDEFLEHHQTARSVSAAVGRLSPAMAELYHLRAQGLSYDELSEVLGVPLGTVKSRMHELIKRLQAEVRS